MLGKIRLLIILGTFDFGDTKVKLAIKILDLFPIKTYYV
jgi:hypothetical protein